MAGLQRQSLVDQLAERLLDIIIRDKLDEGDVFPSTSQLAAQFDVSVIAVREAIAILVGRGVISRRQGSQAVVLRPGSNVIESLFRVRASQDGISAEEIQQCRSALELQAAALAASALDEAGRRAHLEPLLQMMKDAREIEDLVAADQKFHEGIIQLSGNRALGLIVAAVRTAVLGSVDDNWHRWFLVSDDGAPGLAIQRHEAIANAIIAGDRSASVRAMADHFLEWQGYIDFGGIGDFSSDGVLHFTDSHD
jgi:GntR family transcriptional repressor for pyruvate dehydrogenase complex